MRKRLAALIRVSLGPMVVELSGAVPPGTTTAIATTLLHRFRGYKMNIVSPSDQIEVLSMQLDDESLELPSPSRADYFAGLAIVEGFLSSGRKGKQFSVTVRNTGTTDANFVARFVGLRLPEDYPWKPLANSSDVK